MLKVRAAAVPAGDLLAMIPADFKFPVQTPDIAYVVIRGDSLSVIARRFNTSVSRLVSLNQLASRNRIAIGQRLLLPQDNVDASTMAVATPGDGDYTVRRGDTLALIAARHGVTSQALLAVNAIVDPQRIYPGQQLRLPGFERSDDQSAAIVADITPLPPTLVQFSDALELASVEFAGREQARSQQPSVTPETATATAENLPLLALNETRLPPAAVLPDNAVLAAGVTPAEEQAIALDPVLDVAASNEQLTEALSADPSDYSVAGNSSIEIQASETLGHYADWLGIRAWDLRRINKLAFRDPVIIGKRLTLAFSRVNIAEFELKRRDFHSTLQREFFSNYRIQGVEQYQVKRRDNIGAIAMDRYSTPIWLLRQYNPGLEFNRIQIDEDIIFPLLERVQ